MSIRNRWLTVLAVSALLALGLATAAFTKERHPEIRAAQRALHNAKVHLAHADRDFGGHRTKAVQLIDQAQDELRQALEYDRK